MSEESHQAKLRQVMEENLVLYQDQLNQFADPAEALQAVFEVEKLKLILAQPIITVLNSDPQFMLDALSATENWYTSRDYKYPQPKRLAEQREYWTSKLKNQTRS